MYMYLHVNVFALFVLRVTCRERGGYINLVKSRCIVLFLCIVIKSWKCGKTLVYWLIMALQCMYCNPMVKKLCLWYQ